jgi:uncharacterized phage-associated protein
MMKSLFDERRTAEAAAYLLHLAGGTLHVVKLLKLMYLAERRSLQRYGEPISGDKLVSMPHGPVLSMTYDHINGTLPSVKGGWDTWVKDRANHKVSLKVKISSPNVLGRLSDADLEILQQVWNEFGRMTQWDLVDYTHSQCAEWEDPLGSSAPISYESLFKALGYSQQAATDLISRLREQAEINAAFA